MPRKPQDENSILAKIADRSRSSRKLSGTRSASIAIGDDAALFRPALGCETILTCDWFLEGTHFLRHIHPPDAIGWKCLARAISDIAAMGGEPRCFLLSLALPETHTGRWLDLFLGGLRRASHKFHCLLAGGDTTRQRKILISVTVVGEVRTGRAAMRSGARPGDILFVSGRLGEAELGLRLLRRGKVASKNRLSLTRKHFYPEPRLALGQWMLKKGIATAMMDLSDGLSTDLPRLCAASSVGATVELDKIPQVHIPQRLLKDGLRPLQLALNGGDDYELLFSVPPAKARLLPDRFRGVALSAIGQITRARGLFLIDKRGIAVDLAARGWDPFAKRQKW